MLTLKLYPAEFYGLAGYLYTHTRGQSQVSLTEQSIEMLLLLECRKVADARRLAWSMKRTNRLYAYRLSPVHALALHQDMRRQYLDHREQAFLAKLDQAMLNYLQPPTLPVSLIS